MERKRVMGFLNVNAQECSELPRTEGEKNTQTTSEDSNTPCTIRGALE